jgi:oligosaccharide repeat unit polymerase
VNNLPLKIVLAAVQLVSLFGLFAIAVSQERKRRSGLPLILTPMIVIAVAVGVSSIAALSMDDYQYVEYSKLWFFQIFGLLLGMLFSNSVLGRSSPDRPSPSRQIVLSKTLMKQLAMCLFVAGFLSAVAFFAWKGIPLLSGNVEQSRVDLASAGTGYFRLMAYLTIPAALLSFALTPKIARILIPISLIIILFLADRSPLLYLFIPLVFVSISRKIKFKRPSSLKPIIMGILFMSIVVGVGTYRAFTQSEFLLFPEYSAAIQSKDFGAIALFSFEHYANVVANNAVLTKSLIDSGTIDFKYGASYFSLFSPVLPGKHLTLDAEIKQASGKTFIGGGIPPTLMGEGYANFGYAGTIIECGFVVFLLEYWYGIVMSTYQSTDRTLSTVVNAIYGYMVCWGCMSQVAGLAGASVFPFAGAVTLLIIWGLSTRSEFNRAPW